jgi:hypothetical protein
MYVTSVCLFLHFHTLLILRSSFLELVKILSYYLNDTHTGQGSSDVICKKPKPIGLQFIDGERPEKVVCGNDVSAVVTSSGETFNPFNCYF